MNRVYERDADFRLQTLIGDDLFIALLHSYVIIACTIDWLRLMAFAEWSTQIRQQVHKQGQRRRAFQRADWLLEFASNSPPRYWISWRSTRTRRPSWCEWKAQMEKRCQRYKEIKYSRYASAQHPVEWPVVRLEKPNPNGYQPQYIHIYMYPYIKRVFFALHRRIKHIESDSAHCSTTFACDVRLQCNSRHCGKRLYDVFGAISKLFVSRRVCTEPTYAEHLRANQTKRYSNDSRFSVVSLVQ